MPYIKLLTVLAGLALLTACGGGTAETPDTAGGNATDCKTNAFHADCSADAPAIKLRQDMCLEDTTADPTCIGETGIATVFCKDNPFDTSKACVADTGAIALRQSMCLADIMEDDSCRGDTGIATLFCKDDPFNTATACMADTYFPDRVADCITDGNAGIARCNNLFTASASNTCLTNPFTDACKTDGAFGTYADMARTNRVSFCESNSGSLCTALTTCQTNPFHASCGAYFAQAKISHCETNDVADCPNVTTADLLASFTANGGTALPTTPNTTPTNEFLAISATTASSLTAVVPTTLFMTGSTTNGAAFFIENDAYYAGILAGTNLGAPITETITTAVRWTGQIRAVSNNGDVGFTKTDFWLDITFDGATGTMDTFFETAGGYYLIDGDFDAKGIISGNIAFAIGATGSGDSRTINTGDANYSPGTLTGIIGSDGAVGAFHSGHATLTAGNIAHFNPYAGGFVVKPPRLVVNHADWLTSFGASPPPATRTTGTDTFGGFLNLASDVRAISETGLIANSVVKGTLTLDGDGTNGIHGVTYLSARNTTSDNNQAFVAVFPTTNLGAPLTQASGEATWSGTYFNNSLVSPRGINFKIDFGMKKITAEDTFNLGVDVTIDFALDFTATGVITGTVTEGTPATAHGLIGEKGLVGVYVDTRTTLPDGSGVLYGGFIADNPDN